MTEAVAGTTTQTDEAVRKAREAEVNLVLAALAPSPFEPSREDA